MNKIREKILLLLLGGLALGLCYTPYQQKKVFRIVSNQWKKIDQKKLREGISYLYKLGLVSREQKRRGVFCIFPTAKARLWLLEKKLHDISSKKQKWDRKWRMVAFDIPEKYKTGRDALRRKLKEIGFCELQKSVFVTPHECKNEIIELIKFFDLDKHVRFGVLNYIDNEIRLKDFFKLS